MRPIFRGRASLILSAWLSLGLLATLPCPGQDLAPLALSLKARLSKEVRTQDFRKGVPPALSGRNLPEGVTELANPYLPDDRRIFKVRAMAPHPQGGIVFWADATHFSSNDDDTEFHGLWRMESDGQVTAYAVESESDFQHASLHCDAPFQQVTVGQPDALIVEPSGDVLAAQSSSGVIVRLRRDGFVERIAGGGEDWCHRNNASDLGYRDGPGTQALFSNKLAIALARDGGIYVAEQDASRRHFLERIRHVDPQGVVTTLFTGENCWGRECSPMAVAVGSMVVDQDGQLILADTGMGHNSAGQEQGHATAHRLDPVTVNASLIAFSVDMIPAKGIPFGLFSGLALLPDGRPISKSGGGFVLLDGPKSSFNYWVKWREGHADDGPVASTSFAGDRFCVAGDGAIFMSSGNGVRRLDPKTQRVSTWLR